MLLLIGLYFLEMNAKFEKRKGREGGTRMEKGTPNDENKRTSEQQSPQANDMKAKSTSTGGSLQVENGWLRRGRVVLCGDCHV
jgi:hypothetical protein